MFWHKWAFIRLYIKIYVSGQICVSCTNVELLLLREKQQVFIKCGVMNDWTSICHGDQLTQYISQHTAHNDQFPLDAINNIKKQVTISNNEIQ